MTKIKYKNQIVSVKSLNKDELADALMKGRSISASKKGSRTDKILSELKRRGKGSILRALK